MLIGMYHVHESVIDMLKSKYSLYDENIGSSVETILRNYSNEGLLENADSIDYSNVIFRLAYIYLYGTSHVHLTYSSLCCFKNESPGIFFEWINDEIQVDTPVNLLSVGGGPGTDLVGLLLFLQSMVMSVNCAVVDAYEGWEELLWSTIRILNVPNFYCNFDVQYNREDLLKPLSKNMKQLLREANFVTISKFVSAITANNSTAIRLKAMFQQLQVGTLVYFVDNAGGEAFRLGERVASSAGLVPVWGPIYHHQFHIQKEYEPMDEVLANPRFAGVRPQTSTKVSIVIWKKVETASRGLKRSLNYDPSPYMHLAPQVKRSRIVARKRLPFPSSRMRSVTAPFYEHRPRIARHRRVVSENAYKKGLSQNWMPMPFFPQRGYLSPYNLRNLNPSFNTPKTSNYHQEQGLSHSPYSYSDKSFSVPITPMIRRQVSITQNRGELVISRRMKF